MTDPEMTVATYTAAFETWGKVANLDVRGSASGVMLSSVLADGIAHVRAAFPDEESRPIDAYCDVFDAHLSEHEEYDDRAQACARLRTLIRKSCLLDRLLYVGEPLRTVPCPIHQGRWNGCFQAPCPHGCNVGACGCTTGWIPVETGHGESQAPVLVQETT